MPNTTETIHSQACRGCSRLRCGRFTHSAALNCPDVLTSVLVGAFFGFAACLALIFKTAVRTRTPPDYCSLSRFVNSKNLGM
jgi:hypothetical protein